MNQYAKSGDIGSSLHSRYQRSSRIDGMRVLAYKEHSQVYLERLRSLFPDQMPFFPRGWCLPEEHNEFDKVYRYIYGAMIIIYIYCGFFLISLESDFVNHRFIYICSLHP